MREAVRGIHNGYPCICLNGQGTEFLHSQQYFCRGNASSDVTHIKHTELKYFVFSWPYASRASEKLRYRHLSEIPLWAHTYM